MFVLIWMHLTLNSNTIVKFQNFDNFDNFVKICIVCTRLPRGKYVYLADSLYPLKLLHEHSLCHSKKQTSFKNNVIAPQGDEKTGVLLLLQDVTYSLKSTHVCKILHFEMVITKICIMKNEREVWLHLALLFSVVLVVVPFNLLYLLITHGATSDSLVVSIE